MKNTKHNMSAGAPNADNANEAHETVVAAVHELNNILSVIMTESELAVLVGSEKKRVQALRSIATSAGEMREILARLQANV